METICDFLTGDHRRCDDLFAQVETSVTRKDWPRADGDFLRFHRLLASHIEIEERILFPAFDNALQNAAGPLAMLQVEHQRLRGLLERMQQALLRRDAVDFMLHAESYVLLNHDHGIKEEGMLYRLLDRAMAGAAGRIVAAMCEARAAHEVVAAPGA